MAATFKNTAAAESIDCDLKNMRAALSRIESGGKEEDLLRLAVWFAATLAVTIADALDLDGMETPERETLYAAYSILTAHSG